MRIEIVHLNAPMARLILLGNTSNRPLRPTHVTALRQAMLRGEWRLTHQGVAIAPDKTVLDGQHRLAAIAGLPDTMFIPTLVTYDAEPETFALTDLGMPRSLSDALRSDGLLTSVARIFAVLCDPARLRPTPTQMRPYLELVMPYHQDLMVACNSRARTWSSAPIRAAAVLSVMRRTERQYVHAVYRALVLGNYGDLPPVGLALVKAVANGHASARDGGDLMARALVAFDPKRADLGKIQVYKNDVGKLARATLRPMLPASVTVAEPATQ